MAGQTDRQIEGWALRIVDAVGRCAAVEDARVELKAQWPDPIRAARRIAGHANAAQGADILWLIGVDESVGVVDVEACDIASWWAQVQAQFNGIAPSMRDLVVSLNGRSFTALVFDASRAPFVVRNSSFGQAGGGAVELEVPWRIGTSTQSARREDLIRLLEPIERDPFVEILDITMRSQTNGPSIEFSGSLYVVPNDDQAIVYPRHRRFGFVHVPEHRMRLPVTDLSLGPPIRFAGMESFNASRTIDGTRTELIVHGPGEVQIYGKADVPFAELPAVSRLGLELHLMSARSSRAVVVSVEATSEPATSGESPTWKYSVPDPTIPADAASAE